MNQNDEPCDDSRFYFAKREVAELRKQRRRAIHTLLTGLVPGVIAFLAMIDLFLFEFLAGIHIVFLVLEAVFLFVAPVAAILIGIALFQITRTTLLLRRCPDRAKDAAAQKTPQGSSGGAR